MALHSVSACRRHLRGLGLGHDADLPSLFCLQWKETQRRGLDPSPLLKCVKRSLRATKPRLSGSSSAQGSREKADCCKCQVMRGDEDAEEGQ